MRRIEAFESETQQEAVSLAAKFLSNIPDNTDSWAYVQDGLVRLENGQKQDVYFIKAWAQGMDEPLQMYQAYNIRPFELVGNIKILNYADTGLSSDDANLLINALDEGIYSHPSATREGLEKLFN